MEVIICGFTVIFIVIVLCEMCYNIGFDKGWYAAIKEYHIDTMSEQKDEEEQTSDKS